MTKYTKQAGFTLVELAIVLVIIGLIVGGVLAGQDLIKAAEQRAAIGQFEKLDTVVNAFRGKYNGIPGDLSNPGNFGMVAPSVTTTQGNGVLDAPVAGRLDQEPAAFFAHLATASLINESITRTQAQLTTTTMTTAMGDYAPISKLGKGIYVWAMTNGGTNYYMLDNATLAATGVITNVRTALTPIVAYNLDVKLDDAVPTTGKVQAVDDVATAATTSANAGALSGKCVNSTPSPNVYQTSTAAIADVGSCALRIKASF